MPKFQSVEECIVAENDLRGRNIPLINQVEVALPVGAVGPER